MRLLTKLIKTNYFGEEITLPKEFKFLACDECGSLFAHKEKPKALDGILGAGYVSKGQFPLPYGFDLDGADWRTTLIEII